MSVPEPGSPPAVDDPVAIVGIGCRLPGATGAEAFWQLLREGRCAIGRVPPGRWATGADEAADGEQWGAFLDGALRFDAAAFGISAAEAAFVDPQHLLLLETCRQAMEQAGIAAPQLAGRAVGVFIAIGASDHVGRTLYAQASPSAFSVIGSAQSMAANRVSGLLGVQGPSVCIDTGCSSSLVALQQAHRSLLAGEIELAIVGGVNLMLAPQPAAALARAWMLSSDGRVRAFERSADGYVRGEGCGVLVLERLSDAQRAARRVAALVRGIEVGFCCPRSPGEIDPPALAAVITRAHHAAGLTPEAIGHVEAHGVGSPGTDAAELAALQLAFGSRGRQRPLGSAKANVGHLEWASGMVGLIKGALILRHGVVPAQPHPADPIDGLGHAHAGFALPAEAVALDPAARAVGVTAVGLGGTAAHAVLCAGDAPVASSGMAEAAADAAVPARPRVVFLFTGQGAQLPGMGRELYETEAVFREVIDRCDALTAGTMSPSLREVLYGPASNELIHDTTYTQPVLFAFELALAALWRAWGVTPDAVVGHSVGEFAAACVAGVFTLEEGLALVVERGRLIGALPRAGSMAAVIGDAALVAEHVARHAGEVAVAAFNAPDVTVVSGLQARVDALLDEFDDAGLAVQPLQTSHAFHSPLMAPIDAAFAAAVARTPLRPPRMPLISNLSGRAAADIDTVGYWCRHLREPVRFGASIEHLASTGHDLFVEIGPKPTLTRLGLRSARSATWIASLDGCGERAALAGAAAKLRASGIVVTEGGAGAPVAPAAVASDAADDADDADDAVAATAATAPRGETRPAQPSLPALLQAEAARVLSLSLSMLAPDRPLTELGLRSLAAIELTRRLEEALGLRLPQTLLFEQPTLDALAAELQRRLDRAPASAERIAPRAPAPPAGVHEPVAVIGMGCRLAGGVDGPAAFWQLLQSGTDATRAERRWRMADDAGTTEAGRGAFLDDVEGFDAAHFGIAPAEALDMDPQLRLLLEVGSEALHDAGLQAPALRGSRTGVFIGASAQDYFRLLSRDAGQDEVRPHQLTGNLQAALAGRLSYFHGWHGPSVAVDTACSSSLVALHLAARSLRDGEADLALAGGVNLVLDPVGNRLLARLQAVSPSGRCSAFDASADGYVRGEGCGVVVLKRLADAERDGDRVLALIRGSAVNHDGRSSGFTVPSGSAQRAVIRDALAAARVGPGDVQYVEAHGTGTRLGDPIEVAALADVFCSGDRRGAPLHVGTCKPGIGHLEAAAGVAGFIKAVLSLQQRRIAPQLHLREVNPLIEADPRRLRFATEATAWHAGPQGRIGGVSSFGMSGTNAHLVVQEAPERLAAADRRPARAPLRWNHRAYWAPRTRIERPAGTATPRPIPVPCMPLHRVAWQAAEPLPAPHDSGMPRRVLVLGSGMREAQCVTDALAAQGHDATAVALPPWSMGGASRAAQWAAMEEAVVRAFGAPSVPPDTVIVACATEAGEPSPASLAHAAAAVGGLMAGLARRAAAHPGASFKLWLVTQGVQPIAGGPDPGAIVQALLWGAGLAFAVEHRASWGGLIDLGAGELASGAHLLLREVLGPAGDDQVAYRGGRRYLPRLERFALGAAGPASIHSGSTCLVVGGTGGVGRHIAAELARRGAPRIVLASRHASRSAPEPQDWPEGVRLELVDLDVTDAAAVRALVDRIQSSPAPLAAVVHAAGAVSAIPLTGETVETWLQVLDAKVSGAWNLHCATAGLPLQHFICTSSIASVWGGRHQAAYAAANRFLDALVQLRHAQGLPALALNLGPWQDTGMAAGAVQDWLAASGVRAMRPRAALDALGRLMAGGQPQATIADVDWDRLQQALAFARGRPMPLLDGLAGAGTSATPAASPQSLVATLLDQAAGVLGLARDELGADSDLLDAGMDSLMALQLRDALARCGIALSVLDLLRGRSATGIARQLDGAAARRAVEAPPALVAEQSAAERWLLRPQPRPQARVQLVCFPYAGAGPAMFTGWLRELPPDVELVLVQMPGKGARVGESPFRCMEGAVTALAPLLSATLARPFITFGHCLGGVIAHQVVQRLCASGGPRPLHMIASGARAPSVYTTAQFEADVEQFSPLAGVPGHHLPDALLARMLGEINFSTLPALLNDDEVQRAFFPAVRADLELNNTFRWQPRPALDVPITSFGGRADPFATGAHVAAWRSHTCGRFALEFFSGDHYFVDTQRSEVIARVVRIVESSLAAEGANPH